jgi:hypothetical protein
MAEQLPIVAWQDGDWVQAEEPVNLIASHAQPWVALTPHAPAQSALDELRAENAALKEKLQEQALQALSDDGQWMERTDELRREVEALRADAERYRWLRNKAAGWIRNHCSLCIASTTPKNTTAVYGKDADELIDTARASTDEGVGK